ncbi:dihydrofolate reductase [Rhizobiales bacterium RZME27]|uniref:Dihydrofolate reductase n=1 Tax=Endobacterium cereale TaxID=2663029 RepID=A0A6A8A4G8_9HYPH|nr:dihydrofolate reductase family protein [Endobacterium cereale]MEB2844683.1 dihydrofolate reductase family protein [Endobacterium cereale]MQY45494.1 dihydrofolate reductase [Endobacterium cereale]
MRKLVVWNLMTLDGYFEGEKPWDLSFHEQAWGPELEKLSEKFGEEGDLLVFGRKTYEGMAAYWPEAQEPGRIKDMMNSIAKLAVSKTLTDAAWNNTRVVTDPVAELTRLKQEDGKTIFVFGSAELVASLLEADLIDEYRLCIVPVLLGKGNPLFKNADAHRKLTLVSSDRTGKGAVLLTYTVG